MIGYQDLVGLSQSHDSNERGHAAYLTARAYLEHSGPADEQAALYAALIGFLDDSSVRVRASLAFGLIHAENAPRPILLALLKDSAMVARAVLQYSPALVDADLMPHVRDGEVSSLLAIAERTTLSARVAAAILSRQERDITLRILKRGELQLAADSLLAVVAHLGDDPQVRGALLARRDLPATGRLVLVQKSVDAIRASRIVAGALQPDRLGRLLRDSADGALSAIGETEPDEAGQAFVGQLIVAKRINTRLLIHAVVTGRVLFFANCLAELSGVSRRKVFSVLEHGSRPALNALLARSGLDAAVSNLLIRLVMHARVVDLGDDVAARHFVVTALTQELIAEYEGDIPPSLEAAFAYLSDQNISLARQAARGVMAAFADTTNRNLPLIQDEPPAPVMELGAA